jgi:hypothetical protein
MPSWITLVPTVFNALVQLTKLLIDLYKENQKDDIKCCAAAIEDARKNGDATKLTAIIEKMRKGHSCE